METHRPSISLLVPCYNAGDYLRDFLAGAKGQTWPYHEIICYDDASIDRTAELIESEGITVIRSNRNRGPAYARQKLLEAATGDFVHFHDVDDFISNRFVEVISPLLDCRTAGVCARCQRDEHGTNKTISLAAANFLDNRELVVRNFLHFNQTVFPATLAKRHMEFAADLRILEDRLAFLSMAANGLQFRYVDSALTTIVKRRGSVTTSQSHADGMDCLFIFWNRAVAMAGDQAQALAEYVSYTAWCYYYEDATVFPHLTKIIRDVKSRGLLKPSSRMERLLGGLLAPETVYWLRRKRAHPRSLNRNGTTAVGLKTKP